jgi:agmatinase
MVPKFVYDLFVPEQADVIVLGIPLGRDSRRALTVLRRASRQIEPFDLETGQNLLEGIKIADVGNLRSVDPGEISHRIKAIVQGDKFPLILGGDHLLTLYTLNALGQDTRMVVLDAHCDLKNTYQGSKYNSATWLRRLCERVNLGGILLLGVRSCDEDELAFARAHRISYFTSRQIREHFPQVAREVRKFASGSTIYLSIDMDVFDPAIAPAVRYPEPGGLSYSDFVRLIDEIVVGELIAADLVELTPLRDDKITQFLAVKILFWILGSLRLGQNQKF